MTDLFQYLLEVTLTSSILYLGYILLKGRLSIPFKRFYLLGCIILPLLFPLVTFNTAQPELTIVPQKVSKALSIPDSAPIEIPLDITPIPSEEVKSAPQTANFDWAVLVIFIYLSISMLLIIRLGFSLIAIFNLIRNAYKKESKNSYHIVNDKRFTGGSFFKWVFVQEHFLNKASLEIILAHEQVHVKHWHSVDTLLAEINCAIFWINPMAWIIRKEIKLNVEHETDAIVANYFGKEQYANVLLQLSLNKQNLGPILSFSAFRIRKRLQLILHGRKHHWAYSGASLPFLILSFWLISCEPEMMDFSTMDPQTALKNVKTVTTRYISHQKDTQQKDGNIIAIAYYLPDGTVDKVVQHMTYPYDFEQPFERTFLTSLDPSGVLHILNGFELGDATNNILFGNDWPKYKDIDDFGISNEMFERKIDIEKNVNDFPVKITIMEELKNDIMIHEKTKKKGEFINEYVEEFSYENQKITSRVRKLPYPGKFLLVDNNKKVQLKERGQILSNTDFKYNGNNLVQVINYNVMSGSSWKTKLNYENGILVSSSSSRKDKQYTHREFHYNSDGLKTRTEIFNVYSEPEYTIIYDYEYY